ncbi:MAG: efflux transporter outer membrane subunit [Candidatus Competibacteraceae bacterium]|uniref:RND efflux system, outer membrane lipoprotein, NodT family n=1 Tax=Candidatus Contendobacter odensis Run_B_J11 TaxID=1400861 RepID=A0A7U7GDV8_9GAMM|nr:efflux transporter outer membrane subunit [Candidatus Contendobacter odensis]MBK8535639.1 efflux transporter outer membrane subunit [Candidatus Competibacteraceae bacterium]CDH46260.1 RND efflux system, outer membrane lipoprotein, NodT family [Candidatus Contendobacter odensis Run_B_J11]
MLANHNDLHADHRKNAAQWISNLTIVGCLTLALCGCAAIAPQPTAPVAVAVPTAWSTVVIAAPNGSSSLVQWWSRFNDPLLSNLVSQALQANTSIKSAEAVLQQTRALRDVSAAALLPVVGSSASARRSQVGSNSAVNSFEAGLDASWELDLFGANRSALDASDATVLASAATLGDVQVSIAAEIALDYIALRGAQVLLAIANDNLSSQLETLQIAQWRLQAGLVTSLEVEQARTEAEQTRAQLPVLQTSIEQSRYALAVLIGQPPAALSTVLTASGPVPQTDDNLALSLPAETLRQRPDVRAAEDQVTAAIARVAQADAALAPNFQIGGSLGLSALTLGALTHGASVVSVLLASVSLPVFDGGALRAQVRAQQAVLDQAYMAYQAAVLTALKDVEDALVALRNDRERLLYLQRAAEAAVNAALLARQRYGSGLVDFQTVLDTQRTQLNTQYSVATARATLSADHVRLYKALGGGWNPNGGDATAALTESRTYRP